MKLEELRIGNAVKAAGVHGLLLDGAFQITANGIKQFSDGVLLFDPVPLSEAWLVYMGYKFSDIDGYWVNPQDEENFETTLRIIQSHDKFRFYEFNSGKQLDYVHEAQNFRFCFCGEELKLA